MTISIQIYRLRRVTATGTLKPPRYNPKPHNFFSLLRLTDEPLSLGAPVLICGDQNLSKCIIFLTLNFGGEKWEMNFLGQLCGFRYATDSFETYSGHGVAVK
jgi:hypothetical protein